MSSCNTEPAKMFQPLPFHLSRYTGLPTEGSDSQMCSLCIFPCRAISAVINRLFCKCTTFGRSFNHHPQIQTSDFPALLVSVKTIIDLDKQFTR
ncbi:hypothetical protein ACFOG5_19195 [Pedobacter fastidiosus]|uniref:hypothetical protein n=1 Tax=Pedobacter fastidiosus TaxID=2765361 RepID=UPI003613AF6F